MMLTLSSLGAKKGGCRYENPGITSDYNVGIMTTIVFQRQTDYVNITFQMTTLQNRNLNKWDVMILSTPIGIDTCLAQGNTVYLKKGCKHKISS